MSHAGPPPEPPEDPHRSDGGADASGQPAGEQQPYNPYPDDWDAPPTGNPAFTTGPQTGTPYGSPYGQPYGYAGQPGQPPVNPYAAPDARKPTFGFGGYAGWATRVGAYLIDQLAALVAGFPLWIGYAILLAHTSTTTNLDGTTTTHYSGSPGLAIALVVIGALTSIAFFVWNICIRQGRTGASVGKSVLAVRLVNADLQPIGPGWCFLRSILHIVDSLPCYLGYLWPIWDAKKQTFADKIMSTYVIQATTAQPPPY